MAVIRTGVNSSIGDDRVTRSDNPPFAFAKSDTVAAIVTAYHSRLLVSAGWCSSPPVRNRSPYVPLRRVAG